VNFMQVVKQIIKKIIWPSPYKYIKRQPNKFIVDTSTVLFDTTRFTFCVPNHMINPCIQIGKESMIGCEFIFESTQGRISVGNRTYIGNGTKLISRSSIRIGDDVTIAWGCYLYDHNSHSLNWEERNKDIKQQMLDLKSTRNFILNKDWSVVSTEPIVICDKAWIGFEAVILKGVTVGEGAIVGARSVVTKDVEPWTVVAGNPARVVKKLKEERLAGDSYNE
jgi:acetyltransferase-like isoleucine patch superfamily enzyme